MAVMSKSFLFYVKNWDVMEHIGHCADSGNTIEYENIFKQARISNAEEKDDAIREAASEYCFEFLGKIRARFKEKHLDYLKIYNNQVKNRTYLWERDFFIGRTLDDVKAKKWRISFYVRKYKGEVCVLSFIVRFAGKTMTLKREMDAIINTSIKNEEGEIYYDSTHLAFVKLPTDWKKETDDEPIIEEIVQKTIQALPEEKLNKILKLN
jgi:hypothetical protein